MTCLVSNTDSGLEDPTYPTVEISSSFYLTDLTLFRASQTFKRTNNVHHNRHILEKTYIFLLCEKLQHKKSASGVALVKSA